MCLPATLCIFETSETNRESKAVSTSVQLAEPQAHTDAYGGRPNSHQHGAKLRQHRTDPARRNELVV
jgi:hypothetical protein